MTVRVGVIGCGGRMGTVVLQALAAAPEVTIAGAVEREGHPLSGRDLGSLTGGPASGALVGTDLQALLARAHVIVEFSSPEASLAHAERWAREIGHESYAMDDQSAITVIHGESRVISEGAWRHFES